ncbi:unnamed protein product [Orchesella dallaii]
MEPEAKTSISIPSAKIQNPGLVEESGTGDSLPLTHPESFKEIAHEDINLEGAGGNKEPDSENTFGSAVAGLSNWFSSTVSTAKEKSSEMYEYLKEDFSEISLTVSEASKDLKEKLKIDDQSFKHAVESVTSTASLVLDQMSNIFGVGPDDGDDDEEITVGGPTTGGIVDRVQAKIYSLAIEEDAFLKDPEDTKAFENWLQSFDLDKKNCEMSDLMTANPHLQLHYSHLVPGKVSHLVFWHRFYYRVHEIQVAEQERRSGEEEECRKSLSSSSSAATKGKESEDVFIDANSEDSAAEH